MRLMRFSSQQPHYKLYAMNKMFFMLSILSLLFINHIYALTVEDSLKFYVSINYYLDLSDTYGKGDLLKGEFKIMKSNLGTGLSYGHFHGHSIYIYKIILDEHDKNINIQFDEVSLMKTGTFSFYIVPIQNKYIVTDLSVGIVYGKAKSSQFKSVDYSYNLVEEKFNYLYKSYELVEESSFGYQVGLCISFYPFQTFGIQFNSQIQHLKNIGSFFFIGSGFCFRF